MSKFTNNKMVIKIEELEQKLILIQNELNELKQLYEYKFSAMQSSIAKYLEHKQNAKLR